MRVLLFTVLASIPHTIRSFLTQCAAGFRLPVQLLFFTVLLQVLTLPRPVVGQEAVPYRLDPDQPFTQYLHNSWQIKDGLPQNTVNAVVQDERGYIWVGTQAGLARFDGVDFKVFNQTTTKELKSRWIMTLYKDRDGAVWIGTNGGGITKFYHGRFTTYTREDGLSSNRVHAFYEDRTGNLWIATPGAGLNRFDGESFEQFTVEDGLLSKLILSIDGDARGNVWIGTDAGLNRYSNGRIYQHPEFRGVAIPAVYAAEDGTLWIGTQGEGLYRLAGEQLTRFTTADGLSSATITTLYKDPAGALWIGTRTGGLCRFYSGAFSCFTTEEGLTHNRVNALYQGYEGTLWIGTSGGLNQLYNGKFTTYTTVEGLSNNIVLSVLEDHNGVWWVGTDGGGLNRIYGDTITHITTADGLPSNHVYSLHEAHDGSLWIGTYGGGICRLQAGELNCYTTDDGLSSNNIYAIYEDREERLWIGTDRGLTRWHDGIATVYQVDDGLAHNWITAIYEDRQGMLWIGTYGGGISRLHNGQFKNYSIGSGLSSNVILTLHEDHTGTLWIGTYGDGLCRLRAGEIDCVSTQDGLFTADVLQIAQDEYGNLWLGMLKGIERVSLQQLNAVLNGEASSLSPVVYGTGDGLASAEMNGGVQPTAWRTSDGRLLFATMKGLAVVNPRPAILNEMYPRIVLERFIVDDHVFAINNYPQRIELAPGSQAFEFHYTGLSFIAPERMTFKYRLEGYDNSWVKAGARREAYYTNLDPGEYRFQVMAINSSGITSKRIASLSFYVEPFFYQTFWFYLLCAAGLIMLAIGGYRLRLGQLRARQFQLNKLVKKQTHTLREREQELQTLNDELEEEVERQLDMILTERSRYERELITAKQKAEESERLKSTILMNMSHEIRTPLATISGFAQELKEKVPAEDEQFIEFIRRSSQRLLQTLNAVLEMSKLEAGSMKLTPQTVNLCNLIDETVQLFRPQASTKGLTLTFETPDAPLREYLDRTSLQRIMNNLIGNAIKFTDTGSITIRLNTDEEYVSIAVEDTGPGIDESFLPHVFEAFRQESSGPQRRHEGTGLGLAITKHLIELMDGQIQVKSKRGEGSCFTVKLPRRLGD